MAKSLYSLMLSEDVVSAVDAAAHRMGVSRSALVNQILADYVSVTTPERLINSIFSSIEEFMSPSAEIVPFFAPNSSTMSLKSSLAYKYRPTVRYEVSLDTSDKNKLGDLSVIFRTQSSSLIDAMTSFFRLWVRIEDKYYAPILGKSLECALYDGKFVRPLALPELKDCLPQTIAQTISDYISLFDSQLKGYLSGELSERDVANNYLNNLARQTIYI